MLAFGYLVGFFFFYQRFALKYIFPIVYVTLTGSSATKLNLLYRNEVKFNHMEILPFACFKN